MDVLYQTTEELLRVLEEHTGRPVGDAIAPNQYKGEQPSSEDYPYIVLYEEETAGWRMSGPLTGQQEDKQLLYRVVSVGLSRQQASAVASIVREKLSREDFLLEGFVVQEVLIEELGRMFRNTDIRPPVYSAMDLFKIWVTPTGDV